MQVIRKIVATGLAALMAGASLAMPALAATQLGDYPTFLAKDNALDAFVVVGASAATADVVGAVDLAVRLAELSSVTKTVAAAAAAVDGVERDDIALNGAFSNLPGDGVLKNFHYSGLKEGQISWRSNDYDYREQVDVSAVRMRHDWTSNVNGTLKMEVQDNDIKYEYVFRKDIAGTGSTGTPNYTYPITIKLMGKEFQIVGTDSTGVKVLQGSIGTATATSGITYGDYTVYSDQGNNAGWARVIIKDKDGNTKDTLIINQGDSKDSSATGLTVKITAVRALQDGTIVGTDVVVGPTGTTEKTYDTGADVTSTGTASDRFPGETAWGIQVASWGSTAGTISANSKIQVVYKPSETVYKVAGEKVSLPNNYADLGFEGYNTDKFTTVTVTPVTSKVVYNQTDTDKQVASGLNGFEIETSPGSSLGGIAGGNWYTKGYALLNYNTTATTPTAYFGFWDAVKEKILVNNTINGLSQSDVVATAEYATYVLNGTAGSVAVTYPFKVSYASAGDVEFYLNVTWTANATDIVDIKISDVTYDFENKTALSSSAVPEFRLGTSAGEAQEADVTAVLEGTTTSVGKVTQEIVSDAGIVLPGTSSASASDKASFKAPSKALKAKVYFGKLGTAAAATTYKEIQPITKAVAKLDSEVGTVEKASNLVLVGGPCVNTLVAELATAGKFDYTCANWPGENFALVKAVDDGFTTGKVALVVAGTRAADTRLATSVLQNYETKLKGQTASSVKVSGESVATATITAA